jgi:hypothetical protein
MVDSAMGKRPQGLLNPAAFKNEKAVGKKSTHGFEILEVVTLNPLAVDKPLHG